jgi:hypothetical protein
MFERLIVCEYAVGDVTAANANVFYELGVRHAVRPGCTVPLFANQSRLPFDVASLRAMPYRLSGAGVPAVGCITCHIANDEPRRLHGCAQLGLSLPEPWLMEPVHY